MMCSNDLISNSQNNAVKIDLNATDIDGDRLAYNIVSYPKHGTLENISIAMDIQSVFESLNNSPTELKILKWKVI